MDILKVEGLQKSYISPETKEKFKAVDGVSFCLDEIQNYNLCSKGFDIDVELSSILTLNNKNNKIPQIFLEYQRRTIKDGKKLKISDGWVILVRIIKMIKYL